MVVNRNQRRANLKVLQKTAKNIQKNGFDVNNVELDTAALANYLADLIKKPKPNLSSKLSNLSYSIITKSLSRSLDYTKIECASQCTFCCHSFVSVSPLEIFALVDAINAMDEEHRGDVISQLRDQDKKTRGLNNDDKTAARIPRGLLFDNLCRVYNSRPSACRWHHSFSKKDCEITFGDPQGKVPVPNDISMLKAKLGVAFLLAFEKNDLPNVQYELHHALIVALDLENAEMRWFGGEDIFSGVQIYKDPNSIDNPALDEKIEEIKRAATGDFNF